MEMSALQNLEATAGTFMEGIALGVRHRFPDKNSTAMSWSSRGTLTSRLQAKCTVSARQSTQVMRIELTLTRVDRFWG